MNERIIQGEKYYHVILDNAILLGVSSSVLEEYKNEEGYDEELFDELDLYADFSISLLPTEIPYNDILQLNMRDRCIILNALEKWVVQEKSNKIVPLYWEIVADFIYSLYGTSLYNIAKLFSENTDEYKKAVNENRTQKYIRDIREEQIKLIYDKLLKIPNGKGNPNLETKELLDKICLCYRIEPTVLEKGQGYYYHIEGECSYKLSEIDDYYTKHPNESWEKMLLDITGEQLIPISLKVVTNPRRIKPDIVRMLKILITEMSKSEA